MAAQDSDRIDKYVDALVEARKKKGLQRDVATDMVKVSGLRALLGLCGDACPAWRSCARST